MTPQQLLAVERALLAGVLSDDAWHDALIQLGELAGASYLAVMTRDEVSGLIHVVEPVSVSSRVIEDYESQFKSLNPMNSMPVLMRDGDQYLDWAELGHGFIRRSAYYQDFMRVHGLGHIMAYRVDSFGGGPANYLSIHKQINEAAFTADDAAGLSSVHAALSRTFALRQKLHGLQQRQAWHRAALDALSFPIMTLDPLGIVRQANRAAEAWLAAADCPLAARTNCSNHQALQGILRQAQGCAGEPACLASVRLSSDDSHTGTVCVALPVYEEHSFSEARADAVLLMIWPSRPREPAREVLRQVFGLSAAEVVVAELMALGHTPQEIAVLRSRSEETIRSHIKAIFCKMHVNRQADLARLLSELGLLAAQG